MGQDASSRRARVADLYTRYGPLVLSRCRYLLRDEESARDATQEVFVKLWLHLDSYREQAALSTWILKIATNHCLNQIASAKAAWRQRYATQIELERSLYGADPERARWVHQLLAKVDRETQAVAIHYWVDEMTQEEIATLLDRSLPTIRKRLATFQRIADKELHRD